jgi:hypothetical protein
MRGENISIKLPVHVLYTITYLRVSLNATIRKYLQNIFHSMNQVKCPPVILITMFEFNPKLSVSTELSKLSIQSKYLLLNRTLVTIFPNRAIPSFCNEDCPVRISAVTPSIPSAAFHGLPQSLQENVTKRALNGSRLLPHSCQFIVH